MQSQIYFTCYLACGRLLQKDVLCGWEDFVHRSFSRSFNHFRHLSFVQYKNIIISFHHFPEQSFHFAFQILGNQVEPLTEQQLMGLCNLQQSSQQAEDALSQGMEALQQSLVETLSSNSPGPSGSGNVADYMGQMAIAMGKLATLENFLHQVLP